MFISEGQAVLIGNNILDEAVPTSIIEKKHYEYQGKLTHHHKHESLTTQHASTSSPMGNALHQRYFLSERSDCLSRVPNPVEYSDPSINQEGHVSVAAEVYHKLAVHENIMEPQHE